MDRRRFLLGAGAAIVVGPAIVAKVIEAAPELVAEVPETFTVRTSLPMGTWRMLNQGVAYGKSPACVDGLPDAMTLNDWASRILRHESERLL